MPTPGRVGRVWVRNFVAYEGRSVYDRPNFRRDGILLFCGSACISTVPILSANLMSRRYSKSRNVVITSNTRKTGQAHWLGRSVQLNLIFSIVFDDVWHL